MKVAICFSGAIRSFDECIGSTLKYFINNFDNPDIFLHMWTFNNNDGSDINYNFKWRKDNSPIDKILSVLNPKKYVIEEYTNSSEQIIINNSNVDMNKFETDKLKNYGFNCCSMYWKIFKCFELVEMYKNENNIEYDLVIRARLDFLWEDFISSKDFVNIFYNKIFLIKDRYATCSKLVTNDKFFAGNFSTMKKMCNIFNYLRDYQDSNILIEGQTINETHIKKMGFDVQWIGHSKTYYKFMDRHKIINKKSNVFVNLQDFLGDVISNGKFTNELVYWLLNSGYNVNCLDTSLEQYNKINNRFIGTKTNIDYNFTITNTENNIFIKGTSKEIKLELSENIINHIKNNYFIMIDFMISIFANFNLINLYTNDDKFVLDEPLQINNIEPGEIVSFKYLDHGYYNCEYKIISDKKKCHHIVFDKKNIEVSRDTFKIINLIKYYKNGLLPVN
jgi:hypothetical protein